MAVAKSLINRLGATIDALEARLNPVPKLAVVSVPRWLNREDVLERHFALFPRDRDAETVMTLTDWANGAKPDLDSYPYGQGVETSKAWRSILRDRIARCSPAELGCMHALKQLEWHLRNAAPRASRGPSVSEEKRPGLKLTPLAEIKLKPAPQSIIMD